MILTRIQTDAAQQPARRVPGPVVAFQLRRQHDVLQRGESRDQVKRLEHEADAVAANFGAAFFVERAQIVSVEHDPAAAGQIQTGHKAQQRGFSRPRRADDGDAFPGFDFKVDVVQNRQLPVRQAHGFSESDTLYDAVCPGAMSGWCRRTQVCRSVVMDSGMIGKRSRIVTPVRPVRGRRAVRLWWAGAVVLTSAVFSSVLGPISGAVSGAVSGATILVLGDSLSSAYRMEVRQGWVHLLEQRLNANGGDRYRVVNLSAAGETTRGGQARLSAALREHAPDLVILELGGNDGLRGFPLQRIEDNLDAMIVESKAAGSDVLLLGMRLPPNYGFRYTREFASIYETLASRHRISFVPFFLKGVAGDTGFMRSDGVHPKASAQPVLLENVWPVLSVWAQSEAKHRREAGLR